MAEELEPLVRAHLPDVATSYLRSYPSPSDLGGAMGGGTPHLVFLDAASDVEQATQLLTEMARMGSSIQVVAMLSGNDPDSMLRCLRAGAADFLILPFTAEQFEAAQAKLAKLGPTGDANGKEPAKIYAVMPAKGACGCHHHRLQSGISVEAAGRQEDPAGRSRSAHGYAFFFAQDQVDL